MKQKIKRILKKIKHYGTSCYCPVCNSNVKSFYPFGLAKRPEAMCPICNMLERHRAICLLLKRKTSLWSGKQQKMMHVAPEPELTKLFKKIKGLDYLSVDLCNPNAMEKVDITDIPHDDSTFDIIYCSHVLEHVPDDRKAMGEFFRVLKPDGWALIAVPIKNTPETFEDLSVTDPKEREKLFGQHDHVRQYGLDIAERLASVGFKVESLLPQNYMSDDEIQKCRLGAVVQKPVFYCQK